MLHHVRVEPADFAGREVADGIQLAGAIAVVGGVGVAGGIVGHALQRHALGVEEARIPAQFHHRLRPPVMERERAVGNHDTGFRPAVASGLDDMPGNRIAGGVDEALGEERERLRQLHHQFVVAGGASAQRSQWRGAGVHFRGAPNRVHEVGEARRGVWIQQTAEGIHEIRRGERVAVRPLAVAPQLERPSEAVPAHAPTGRGAGHDGAAGVEGGEAHEEIVQDGLFEAQVVAVRVQRLRLAAVADTHIRAHRGFAGGGRRRGQAGGQQHGGQPIPAPPGLMMAPSQAKLRHPPGRLAPIPENAHCRTPPGLGCRGSSRVCARRCRLPRGYSG